MKSFKIKAESKKFFALFLILFFFAACGLNLDHRTKYQKTASYPHPPELKTPVALFIRERNGEPLIMASAVLIDKKLGFFASAKHFVGAESDGQCKIFFGGKVYDGFLLRLSKITDIAVIKIDGHYDSLNFPEPYRIARGIRAGEKVFIRGIHPHPLSLQANKILIPVFRDYYGLLGKKDEFVYDDLEAKITKTDYQIKNKQIGGTPESLAEVINSYVGLRATQDHRFSFAGLSGGPTVNEGGELIGINSGEESARIEITSRGITYVPWVTMNLVPASELENLMLQLDGIK